MDSFIRALCRFLLIISLVGLFTGFVLSLFINTAHAAETRPTMYRMQQTQQLQQLFDRSNPAVDLDFETIATTPQGQQVTRHTTRPVPLTKARLGSLARSATGGPAIAAATAAFLAYDYFFNEDTEQWEVTAPPLPSLSGYTSTTCRYGNTLNVSNVTLSECFNDYIQPAWDDRVFTEIVVGSQTATQLQLRFRESSGNLNFFVNWTANYPSSTVPSVDTIPLANTPATDSQLGDAVKNAPYQSVTDILNDPFTSGNWRERWPEIEPVASDIEDSIGYDVEGTPTDNYDPTIVDGSTATPKPVTQPSTTATEWPVFCSWATVVCDFIDWFKEEPTPPETPELPTTEVQPVEWESGLGSGSCPANPSVELMGTTLEYDLTNACWGASNLFQPILIFLSLIAAAYIIIGARD